MFCCKAMMWYNHIYIIPLLNLNHLICFYFLNTYKPFDLCEQDLQFRSSDCTWKHGPPLHNECDFNTCRIPSRKQVKWWHLCVGWDFDQRRLVQIQERAFGPPDVITYGYQSGKLKRKRKKNYFYKLLYKSFLI